MNILISYREQNNLKSSFGVIIEMSEDQKKEFFNSIHEISAEEQEYKIKNFIFEQSINGNQLISTRFDNFQEDKELNNFLTEKNVELYFLLDNKKIKIYTKDKNSIDLKEYIENENGGLNANIKFNDRSENDHTNGANFDSGVRSQEKSIEGGVDNNNIIESVYNSNREEDREDISTNKDKADEFNENQKSDVENETKQNQLFEFGDDRNSNRRTETFDGNRQNIGKEWNGDNSNLKREEGRNQEGNRKRDESLSKDLGGTQNESRDDREHILSRINDLLQSENTRKNIKKFNEKLFEFMLRKDNELKGSDVKGISSKNFEKFGDDTGRDGIEKNQFGNKSSDSRNGIDGSGNDFGANKHNKAELENDNESSGELNNRSQNGKNGNQNREGSSDNDNSNEQESRETLQRKDSDIKQADSKINANNARVDNINILEEDNEYLEQANELKSINGVASEDRRNSDENGSESENNFGKLEENDSNGIHDNETKWSGDKGSDEENNLNENGENARTEYGNIGTSNEKNGTKHKFKSFEKYQFLRSYEGEIYRGEYSEKLTFKERIIANIEAIELTQTIFNENRIFATEDEKKILAKYTGFGGLRDFFYEEKYNDLSLKLENLVGEKLFKELKEFSYNAYYTPEKIIKYIYVGLESLGVTKFNKVKALEPSCGIGKFFSFAPENYEFEAVEKDLISATIAKFLHPCVKIHNEAFESVDFNEKEYDIVVGNPPYDNIKISDYGSFGTNHSIHNYFAIKSAELLKDNGIFGFIITNYFLDSSENKHRVILNELGDFVSALRMPNDTFKNTNASVLTDLVFFQRLCKKDQKSKKAESIYLKSSLWDRSNPESPKMNEYFIFNEDCIMGEVSLKTNQFGEFVLNVKSEREDDFIKSKIKSINHPIFKDNPPFQPSYNFIDYDLMSPQEKNKVMNLGFGSIFCMENKIYIKRGIDSCEEAYFEDKLPIEKKFLIDDDNILSKGKSFFSYKSFLNKKEALVAQKIIKYRDLIIETDELEKQLSNSEEDTQKVLSCKNLIRETREEILNLTGTKFLNSSKNNTRDKNGIIQEHRLKDIINLDKINSPLIYATEIQIENTKNYRVSDFLFKRVKFAPIKILAKNVEEALQKTLSTKGYIDTNTLQDYLPNMTLENILKELTEKRLIFHILNSEKNQKNFKSDYVLKDDFLSGNVKSKYKEIEAMINNKMEFDNISITLEEILVELKNVFPKDIPYEDIEVNFGANYIDIEIYEDFIRETFFSNPDDVKVEIRLVDGFYVIENFLVTKERYDEIKNQIIVDYGEAMGDDYNDDAINLIVYNEKNVPHFELKELIERTINGKSLEVFHYEQSPDDKNKKIKVHESIPTKVALENADIIRDYFESYCFNKKEFRTKIEKKFNDTINVFSQKKYSFSKYLETPELNPNIKLREHQKNAIFKGILKNSMLLEHEVGAGKTLAGIALVMEQIRMGIITKALILTPNHLATQWANEFLNAYPNAKLLVGDKIESKKDRKEFLSRAKYGSYDAIIMKHSTFENLNVMESFQTTAILDYIEDLKKFYYTDKSNEYSKKQLQRILDRKINSLEKKLEKLAIGKKHDREIAFEDIGIDALIVDEAHHFKNLYINTNQNDIKGLPLNDSFKAMKMFSATQYCHQNNFKLYFLTGTPVSNSISEFYIMQKFLQPDALKKMNISHFDNWQKNFTRVVYSEELDSSGINYKIVARLSNFINVPELMSIYRDNVDIVTNEDIEKQTGRLVPKIKNNAPINVISPRSRDIETYIGVENEKGEYNKGSIIYRMDHLSEDFKNNNMLKCTSDAKKAALDFRLINNQAEDYEESKVNKLVEKLLFHYNDDKYPLSTQLVFCDMGVSKENSQKIAIDDSQEGFKYQSFEETIKSLGLELFNDFNDDGEMYSFYAKIEIDEKGNEKIAKKYEIEELMELVGDKFDLYAEILRKLVKNGIPQNQIAFIGDANSDLKKQELFDKVNKGEVRILIGSTQKMGAGTNVQKRVVALHELDCPWRPSDLQQRAGRVIRQGNLFFENDKENFNIYLYRYATEQTYDSRMFQINEQKLIPLAQLKKGNMPSRTLDSIDAEIASVSDMKAFATGNPFILEKHKIETTLKSEERFFDQFKKNIIQNEREVEIQTQKKKEYEKEILFYNEIICNEKLKKENLDFTAFGIRTTRKPISKNDEDEHKAKKLQINQKIKNIFINFKSQTEHEILETDNLKLIFKCYIGEVTGEGIIKGVLIDQNGNECIPNNMFYRADRGLMFYTYPEIDGILTKMTNFISKASINLNSLDKELRKVESKIFISKKFLENNSLEKYNRKVFLDTLRKDLKNVNEIFKIRNEMRKKGIKISLESKEIQHLLPEYPKLLNEKGKFAPNEENKMDLQDDKPNEIKLELDFMQNENQTKIEEEVKILDFGKNDNTEDRMKILFQNQNNLEQSTNQVRPSDILKKVTSMKDKY